MKYFFMFLMIMTRKGSLMPSVFFGSDGQVMNVVLTFEPAISRTEDWISLSVMRFMWPLRTERKRRGGGACGQASATRDMGLPRHAPFLSQIWSGLLPIEYRMLKNPAWYCVRNISEANSGSCGSRAAVLRGTLSVTSKRVTPLNQRLHGRDEQGAMNSTHKRTMQAVWKKEGWDSSAGAHCLCVKRNG